jgi:hypothetical protein
MLHYILKLNYEKIITQRIDHQDHRTYFTI